MVVRPAGSVFEAIAGLKDMSPTDAARNIMTRKIPFLIARGAMGAKFKDPDVVLAVMGNMTAAELVTNSKMLEGLGIKTNPALRAAYEEGLKKIAKSSTVSFKTSKAAEAVADEGLKAKITGAQEKQLDKMSVEGDWLVLGDKSGSMQNAIEASRQIAGTLARMVKGTVWLVFFDEMPHAIDVTGKDLAEITRLTKRVEAGGGTSIGIGLEWARVSGHNVDGIAVVSDGANHGFHNDTTPRYDAVAADLAWDRTLAHFGANLQAIRQSRVQGHAQDPVRGARRDPHGPRRPSHRQARVRNLPRDRRP